MSRTRWIFLAIGMSAAILAALVLFVLLPSRDPDANHRAAGSATSCGTPVPIANLATYRFVPDQSKASYTVQEQPFGNIASNTVIGTTNTVNGTFLLHVGTAPLVAKADILVNLNTLRTDSAMRDEDVQNGYLETNQYPNAEFVSTCVQGLPMTAAPGQPITFHLNGNLTLHGKTVAADFAIEGQLSGTTVTGTATATIYMTDFGISPPNILNVTVVDNKVQLSIEFTAQAS